MRSFPFPATGQITSWSSLILIIITPKHLRPDQRARRIWQILLVWAIKKIKLRNAAFSPVTKRISKGFTPPPLCCYDAMLQLSLLVIQALILWATRCFTNQGHSSIIKKPPHLMYLFWLRVLAVALSSIRFKLSSQNRYELDSLQFFSLGNVWRLRLGALLISLQYPILSDQLLSLQE